MFLRWYSYRMVKTGDMRVQSAFSRNISRYVAGLLREKDVVQRVVAQKLDRSQAYVSERISGKKSWTLDELDILASLLDFPSGLDLMAEISARVKRADSRRGGEVQVDEVAMRRAIRRFSEPSVLPTELDAVADSHADADDEVEGSQETP